MLEFEVPLDIYNTAIDVVVAPSMADICDKYFPKENGSFYDENYAAGCWTKNGSQGLQCVVGFTAAKLTPGKIHHEAIHAANSVLSARGVVVTSDNDEALTYLSQFIFEYIMSRVFSEPIPSEALWDMIPSLKN